MTTRCKFKCTGVRKVVSWRDKTKFLYEADFEPVTGGSPENEKFYEATPNGSFKVGQYKEDLFQPGKEYFLDIAPVEAVAA